MTYVAPNAAAAANRASRLRKKIAEGRTVTDEERAWLASRTVTRGRPAARPVQAPPRVEPARPAPPVEPAPPVQAPAPPVHSHPEEMRVIDFGEPGTALAPQSAAPQSCMVPGCTHAPRIAGIPRCGITGEKVYPPLKPNAAKAIARGSFFVTGFLIAIFKGLDEVPDPTEVELEDGADAATDIIASRAPQLTVYSDLLAGGYAISAYSIRTMNMKQGKKAP